MARGRHEATPERGLEKCPTGIHGLDEITDGGLPRGRPTLVCGAAGSGKTLLAMEFLVRGVTEFQEPGVFLTFEETAEELTANVASLGFNVPRLILDRQLAIDYVRVERSEIEETGEYDLEGLFVRLGSAIDEIGAKRVVLDTIEALFAGLGNEAILRAELRRLFHWLKERKVTAIVTGEQGDGRLTRHGLEEYVSDCVIVLDHRVSNQIATRRLRIVKYRGSKHGTNEYPTLIGEHGLSVLPISSLGLDYPVSTERISTGIPSLDAMLGGEGYYRGTSILVSGMAGTGKTSLATAFVAEICRQGDSALYCSFEESPEQILRNMRSIGCDLGPWRQAGRLRFHAARPTLYGLEMHLAALYGLIREVKPRAVVVDPISGLQSVGESAEIDAMLTRLIDFLKDQAITSVFTSLDGGGGDPGQAEYGVSSLMDTWLSIRMAQRADRHTRLLSVLKSRGMAHSDRPCELWLGDKGIELREVAVEPAGGVPNPRAKATGADRRAATRRASRPATRR